MKLYLIRHASAVDHIGGDIPSDAHRPLTKSGQQEAQMVGTASRHLGVKPDTFITSPLVRARQTAEFFAETFGTEKTKIAICDALAPGGEPSDVFKYIGQFKRANEVFLFGHEPDLSRLGQTLLWGGHNLEVPLKKAGVCRIDIFDCPPTTPGRLKWLITPKIAEHISG